MTTTLSELKQNRKNRFDSLRTKVDKMDSNQSNAADDRYWKPEVDNAGNGFAIIRFLDAPKGEDVPYQRVFTHGFQGPGGWYIENSLTTINQQDPISEYNRRLWNSGVESDKDIVRKQKRRLSYISNIYVVKDGSNPQNEGKVFLYRYGKKIFDKIKDMMEPQFEDETPVNVFDFWEGANFRLKIRQIDGYRNYDKSEFDSPTALFEGDADIESAWNTEHSLIEFVDNSQFKSYDDLLKRLNSVLGFDTQASELYRPGDIVNETPTSHETAQEKIQEEVFSKPTSSTSEDNDEYEDLLNKL